MGFIFGKKLWDCGKKLWDFWRFFTKCGVPLFPQLWDVGGSFTNFEQNVGYYNRFVALICRFIGTLTILELIWGIYLVFHCTSVFLSHTTYLDDHILFWMMLS